MYVMTTNDSSFISTHTIYDCGFQFYNTKVTNYSYNYLVVRARIHTGTYIRM